MTLDKQTREAIAKAVTKNISEAMEIYEERWITSDELLERFQMFTRDWLRRYGWKLPRERVQIEINNTTKSTRWAYPQHKIERMIADGSMRLL